MQILVAYAQIPEEYKLYFLQMTEEEFENSKKFSGLIGNSTELPKDISKEFYDFLDKVEKDGSLCDPNICSGFTIDGILQVGMFL